jgi:hypothetical protein
MFSRSQSCRGSNQQPRSLDSRVAGNQSPEAYRQASLGEVASHWAVTKVNAPVAPKVCPRRPSLQPEDEGSTNGRKAE